MAGEYSGAESHLSRIETLWSVVQRAHGEAGDAANEAQRKLFEVYGGAIRRYLLSTLSDKHLADELFQDFALKLVSGEFRHADQSKGRFRAYVKTSLFRLIAGHFRKSAKRREQTLGNDLAERLGDAALQDEQFLVNWRDQVLERAWDALADHEHSSGVRYNSILRLRVAEPSASSEEIAQRISELVGKPITQGAARVLIHRARDKFASLLIHVVSDSLANPTRAELESELIDLRLMVYCRHAFASE